tara:strand:- start:63 stop:407 length:345 start_codon:yes stop_codon:yes gene_type:complete
MKKRKPLVLTNEVATPSNFAWFKKNIVIVPVVAAIIAGSFTSIKYVLNLTDTVYANRDRLDGFSMNMDQSEKDITDLRNRLSRGEATWDMAENIFQQLANDVRDMAYDIKDLSR